MQTKVTDLASAIAAIPDGAVLALGGNSIHRSPSAAVHELVRQAKRDLTLIKTAGAYDVDLLCAAGAVKTVAAGFIGFENLFGMAPSYRRTVEAGTVRAWEHACYSVIAGLRAAAQGVPFMPLAGMLESDVPATQGFRRVADPYSGQELIAIPAIVPDVAIIHVQQADELGNARIDGTLFEDVLMATAAKHLIITAEEIVSGERFSEDPNRTTIAGWMVHAVVHAPRGAWPCSCAGYYDFDEAYLRAYIVASAEPAALAAFLEEHLPRAAMASSGEPEAHQLTMF